MNEGVLAILVIVGTIGAGVVLVMYRDLIFTGAAAPPPRQRRPAQLRRPPARSETVAKPAAIVSIDVSPTAIDNNDPEMIAFRAIAKLVYAGVVTETVAIERAFDVRAGSSKAYKAAQSKLKSALAELESVERDSAR